MHRVRTCVLSAVAVAMALLNVRVATAAADLSSSFTITSPTEVPGAVLKPGQYTISVVDHLSDRAIVRLDSQGGSTHVIFLGVNASGNAADTTHPVEWPEKSKGHHALRGFTFAGGRNVEFVYPKADAVALANANGTGVVAIDPASEGRPELSKLTNTDMQMVNLWILTPVRVGPGQKGIDAKRYTSTSVATAAATPVTPMAVKAPTNLVSSTSNAASPLPTVARAEQPARPAAHRARPVVNQLPKTASDLPLTLVGGLLAFAGAATLRLRRGRQA